MTVKHLFPAVEPSLNLDFANSKKLDPRITFTRSSTGTYVDSNGVIKTAAANEARFDHDGATGSSLGLLVEESRTNLIPNSSSASGGFTTSNTTQNYGVAPDGTVTSIRYTPPAIFTEINAYFAVTAGIKYTLSVFLKGSSTIQVRPNHWFTGTNINYGVIDLSTNTVTGFSNGSQLDVLSNGWVRLSCQATASISGSGAGFIIGTYNNQAADIEFWGAQVEAGSFPTSYIPTSGSTVTRSADVASMTGTNFSSWWSSGPSTYYASVISRASNQNNRAILGITGSSTERQVTLSFDVNSATVGTRINNIFYGSSVSMSPLGIPIKAAGAITSSEVRLSVNGTLGNAGSPPRLATSVPTQMDVGRFLADSQYSLNGTISHLAYYPFRLTDAQLEALTL